MRPALIPAMCIAALLLVFVIDLLTPQLFVTAILLDAPIVLSSLTRSSRFTTALVAAALFANVFAGYINGLGDHHRWDPMGIGDRVLAGLSIVFVGYLSTAVQQTARHAGSLEALAARAQRETSLATAIERVRSSLSLELVVRAIAREATTLLDLRSARFILTDREHATTLVAYPEAAEIQVDETRPAPEVASIVARTLDAGDVLRLRRSDAFGRLILDRWEAPSALALPVVDGDRRFGVLVALGRATESFDDSVGLARAYARQAADALAQAQLFEQLGERNAALAERGAVIRDLVYALSHDLRTPLTALGLTLRQARAGSYGTLPAAYTPIVDQSVIATDDVARLADTLLLVARFESGERMPQQERIDLAQLVHQVAGELAAMAHVHLVHLRVDATSTAPVIGDRDDLRRALVNLVANALAHCVAGGAVEVTVKASADEVEVSVADDGFGVDADARAQLFTRFGRGAGRRGGGTGLGLYIVRRVARESGGDARYAPREPRGSVFTIALPAAAK